MNIATNDPEHHISKFIRWAHDKIETEIALNDKIADEFGDEAIAKESKRCCYKLSENQKREILYQLDDLKEDGWTLAASCNEVGIHQTTYYKWKKLLNHKSIK